MKNLLTIIRKYISIALFLILALICLNIGYFIWYGVHYEKLYQAHYRIEYYANSLKKRGDQYYLTDKALKRFESSDNQFAMELNDKGEVIWSYQLPKELHRTYSLSDMASLSRWYLDDYPVRTWQNKYGIFVMGKPKNSVWKLTLERPIEVIEDAPKNFVFICAANLGGILLVFLFIGWRLFISLRPVAKGIDKLAAQEQVFLPEKGIAEDLNRKINHTSQILEKQKNHLNRRDAARTNWISGVSHDIRTPLSMIMGYANLLKQDSSLREDQKEKLNLIENQSQHIKELIEDLNLTSKLEYEMQPLRLQPYKIGSMLREIAAEYYNNNLSDHYSIDLFISDEAEQLTPKGDIALLKRAFRNLIGNSIRHNPCGCAVTVSVKAQSSCCCLTFTDTGPGIPIEVIYYLLNENSEEPFQNDPQKKKSPPHVLGLLLVKQIVESHEGKINFTLQKDKATAVEILLPS